MITCNGSHHSSTNVLSGWLAGLASLDLRALRDARSDGPPSELQARREKYAFFEKQCSEVADGLFLGSDVVARSRETLRAAGVTHVVNCVGFLYPAYFQDELTYLVLYLQGIAAASVLTQQAFLAHTGTGCLSCYAAAQICPWRILRPSCMTCLTS